MTQNVDWASWPRRELYEFEARMSQPFFSVTFRQDVTGLYRFTRENRLSFYRSMVYLCTQAINRIEAFHYAVRDGELLRFDRRAPSFTDLHPGSEHFHIVTLPCEGTIQDFCAAAKAASGAQTTLLSGEDTPDLIFFSCLPWVEITSVTNNRDFDPEDSVPRVIWGKYANEGDRKILHIALELNHRYVDGLHVGRFHQELTALIEAL